MDDLESRVAAAYRQMQPVPPPTAPDYRGPDDLDQLAQVARLTARRAAPGAAQVVYEAQAKLDTRARRRRGKSQQVIGTLAILAGIALFLFGAFLRSEAQHTPDIGNWWIPAFALAFGLTVVGIVWYMIGRFTEWWNDY